MRYLLALAFMASLAANAQVPREQCPGGTLIAIQPDSISLQFNERVTTVRFSPDAEIWRRGTDLDNLQQLVVGDQIYIECTRHDGEVVASVVAAVEKGDGVIMTPHHLVEYRVCSGRLESIAKQALSVTNDNGTCVIHLNPDTKIWRGEVFHDTSVLQLGDDIAAHVTVSYPSGELTADDDVLANLAITEGAIIALRSDRLIVNQYPGADKHSAYPRGHTTVLFDDRTHFDFDAGRLRKGVTIRAVGLDLGHNTIRATNVLVER